MTELREVRNVIEITEWHDETYMELYPFVKELIQGDRNRFFIGDSSPEGICPIQVASNGDASVTITLYTDHTKYTPDVDDPDVHEDNYWEEEGDVFTKVYRNIGACAEELAHLMKSIKPEFEQESR